MASVLGFFFLAYVELTIEIIFCFYLHVVYSFYPPGCRFSLKRGAEIFLFYKGLAPKSRGAAQDFHEFCKNVLEKFSKIE